MRVYLDKSIALQESCCVMHPKFFCQSTQELLLNNPSTIVIFIVIVNTSVFCTKY